MYVQEHNHFLTVPLCITQCVQSQARTHLSINNMCNHKDWHIKSLCVPDRPVFIKPDQLVHRLKIKWKVLSCYQCFEIIWAKIIGTIAFPSWHFIHGSNWSGFIKAGPVMYAFTAIVVQYKVFTHGMNLSRHAFYWCQLALWASSVVLIDCSRESLLTVTIMVMIMWDRIAWVRALVTLDAKARSLCY